ncbi:MAG: GFA family protein [candidate division Zixibacteria bacterium]|nr:GFA family protein [candidate division Zixibacteria bacterium]
MVTGRCLCGLIQFEIHGDLRGIINCHCSKCRRFHGNYGTYINVKIEHLKITKQESLKWFESPEDETANVHRGFCSECGSSLFWYPKDNPTISIAAGALDTPTDLKTLGHIWCSQMSDFYQINDDLPQFYEKWNA